MNPASSRSAVLRRGAGLASLALAVLLTAPWEAARAQPRLRVAGATASNEVKLRTPSEDFQRELRVDLLPGAGPDGGVEDALPGGVTVLVDPLQSQDGVQVPLVTTLRGTTEGGATAPISTRQPLHLEVSGKLPAAGDYTGLVVLVHAGGRETVSLTVTRVQAVPAVQFVATSPAVASSGWGWSPVDATVRLPFKETAGVGGRLSAPQLLQLQRKAPDLGAALIQPQYEGAHFELERALPGGGSLEAITLDGGIPVEAHGSGAVVLRLRGLDGPGEYTGTVRLAVPSGAPVEQAFTVWVRTPWLWGAMLIAMGALSSYAVRLYTQRIRPRAQRLHRALALRERAQALMAGKGAEAKELGLVVRRQIDTLVSEIRRPVRGIRVGDAELAAVEPRLRLYEAWCDVHRKFQALPKDVQSEEATRLLAEVDKALRSEATPTEQLDERLKAVRELDVVGLARAGLKARLQDIQAQARALAKQRGEDDALGFRLKHELLPLLQGFLDGLAQQDVATARGQVDVARSSYFDILCEELATAIAGPRPRGFSTDEWKELTTDLKERLRQARARAGTSVDEAFRLYQGAHAIYVRRLIKELRTEVQAERKAATTDEQRTALDGVDAKLGEALEALGAEAPHEAARKYGEARDALERSQTAWLRQRLLQLRTEVQTARTGTPQPHQLKELDAIRSLLDDALAALEVESLAEVTRRYERARAALQSYPSQPQTAAATMEFLAQHTEGIRVPAEPAPSTPTGGSIPSLPDSPLAAPVLGELEGMPLPAARHMWLVELVMLLLLTSVAVALGLQLLNVFSPTWGGFGAGMTAFLWGFGLHQVGNATFEGLTGLLTRVEKQGTPSSGT
ncbi:AAA family ATPase [Pyxidicoccus xibeiensis]|uniref:hypothetical protein n=1 Tax=Pyxidicoccus xibeiensis TaxID=2906759 RepID=UPI0020A6F3C0|nr:hypothetical protein [Pyxidicoccus xibeiensis]MCP3136012.1 hypothetical protein [Pyxidicoccus xibeiensis]